MFRISYRCTPGYMRTLSRQGSDPSIGALHIPSLMNFPLVPTWKYVLLGHVIASPRLPGAHLAPLSRAMLSYEIDNTQDTRSIYVTWFPSFMSATEMASEVIVPLE